MPTLYSLPPLLEEKNEFSSKQRQFLKEELTSVQPSKSILQAARPHSDLSLFEDESQTPIIHRPSTSFSFFIREV